VRFTGGEPLMRSDLEKIIAGCAARVPGIPLSMTTNAVGLEHRAAKLAAAGLTRINVSLDSVDRAHFAELTRRDRLPSVLAGIRAAAAAGL
ncbi:cyclic pyranopterin phosphate synthase, partial [Halomonas sp. ND22Bw]